MHWMTDREQTLAKAAQGPGTGICLALAELELFWENHRNGAPDVHDLRLNIRIDGGHPDDRIAAVKDVADWLGVEVVKRHGCHIAQRRFGTGEDSVTIEAHYTPDPAQAHLDRAAAKERAGEDVDVPVLAEVAA